MSMLLACVGLTAGLGCDTTARGRDASTQSQRVSEVSVRLEAPSGGTPSVSVLAFRAATSGLPSDEVLPVVDPLVARAPEVGAGCEVRDVAGAARALAAQGGRVELHALGNLSFDLGPRVATVRPTARVYPALASVVGGVVAEAGPVDVGEAPSSIVVSDVHGARESVALPVLPRLLGETWALACAVDGPEAAWRRLVVPAAELARLHPVSSQVPVSLEAVARDTRWISLAGGAVRLSVEVRSSSVVELRQ
jgi:hypothetical protein